ncbi:MAG: hypothetical protein LW626_12615, partial [Verrucomicrobium sp.]|nr:hypothetical protein [Verrucomicrobium sp.]
LQPRFGEDGAWSLRIDGEPGPGYRLQASTNLTSWSDLGQFLPVVFPWTWTEDGSTSPQPWRFFRVIAEPAPSTSP